jgi:hypothetical protein
MAAHSGPKRFAFDVASQEWISTREAGVRLVPLLRAELQTLFPAADLSALT